MNTRTLQHVPEGFSTHVFGPTGGADRLGFEIIIVFGPFPYRRIVDGVHASVVADGEKTFDFLRVQIFGFKNIYHGFRFDFDGFLCRAESLLFDKVTPDAVSTDF